MAYSYKHYTGDGVTVDYAVPFPYIMRTHVHVYVQGVEKVADIHYTWVTSGTIQFTDPPFLNEIITIERQTSRDTRLVNFNNGTMLKESELNLDSVQLFYLMQEAFDWVVKAGDVEGAIFKDRQSILDAISGWIDESQFADSLSKPLDYLIQQWGWDALYEDIDVYEDRTYMTETEAAVETLKTASIDIDAANARIDAVVGDMTILDGEVTYNAGQLTLLTQEFNVKLDANGYVAGFGLYNNGVVSEFIVNADKFAVIKADGTGTIKKPFVIDTATGLIGMDGNLIVGGSVTAGKLAADSVEATNIKAGNITALHVGTNELVAQTANIKDAVITTAKIADLQVTNAKIANLAVDNAKIANLAVTEAKIASLAVTTAKIADANITNAKIANLAVDSAKIANASITNAKIANLAVDTAQIAGNAVTVPVGAFNLSSISIPHATVYEVIQTATIDAGGGQVQLIFGWIHGGGAVVCQVLRDSTVILQFGNMAPNVSYCFPILDAPVSGSHTYTVQLKKEAAITVVSAGCRSILLLGCKR